MGVDGLVPAAVVGGPDRQVAARGRVEGIFYPELELSPGLFLGLALGLRALQEKLTEWFQEHARVPGLTVQKGLLVGCEGLSPGSLASELPAEPGIGARLRERRCSRCRRKVVTGPGPAAISTSAASGWQKMASDLRFSSGLPHWRHDLSSSTCEPSQFVRVLGRAALYPLRSASVVPAIA